MAQESGEKKDYDDSLDSSHVDTLLRARVKAGNKADTTVRIFERNNFYYMFEKDGVLGANYVYGSSTAMKTMGKSSPVNFCVVNHANFESLLRHVLLVKHLRVEIFKFCSAKGLNPASYQLEVRASPGNVGAVEHLLYGEGAGQGKDNFLMAIKFEVVGQVVKLGLAAVDINMNMVKVVEIEDSQALINLETAVVQLGPKEALLAESDSAVRKKIEQLLERNGILVTGRPSKEFSALSDTELSSLFHPKLSLSSVQSSPLCTTSLSACLSYLQLPPGQVSGLQLEPLAPHHYLRLDPRALAGLNLFPNPSAPSDPCLESLFSSHCRTPGGCRLLTQWLKQPLLCPTKINERLDLVEALVSNPQTQGSLHQDHLRRFPDFQRLAGKVGSRKASLQDLYRVWLGLGRLEPVAQCLQELEQDAHLHVIQDNFVKELQELSRDFEKFQQMVETTIDLNEVEQGRFMVKPEFDDQLGELKAQLGSVEEKLSSAAKSKARELGTEGLKLEHSGHQGHYYRLTLKEEGLIRNNKSLTILESNKSGIKFRDSRLDTLAEEFASLTASYSEQQKTIVDEIVSIASGYSSPLHHLGSVISRLDVILAFSLVATSSPSPYSRPIILPDGSERALEFNDLRHPLVELQERVTYIPNSVTLSETSRFHLITGPNMGGKSTYIRSVGTAVVLAQCGSFVPCAQGARMGVMSSVLVRLGASDSQTEGRSTFMAEMLDMASILSTATPHSLVLIDELGRGTSTYDGFGLAWSVSQHLAKEVKAFTLFTTHYTELTQLSEEQEGVDNFHVSALTEGGKLTLLYQLMPGVCNKSFGIDVAKIADFPEEVIQEARNRIALLESSSDLSGYEEGQRRDIIKQGEKEIDKWLGQLKELKGITDDNELMGKFTTIQNAAKNSSNEYIKGLVANAVH